MQQKRLAAARLNHASEARVDMDTLFAEGAFKYVYKGSYTDGARAGQACACKVFKDGPKYEESFFEHEIDVINKAMVIVEKYNNGGYIRNKRILLNMPQIWTFAPGDEYAGQKAMIEPFIDSFEKFNSNSGWNNRDGTAWHQVMQALSHFSYHATGGAFVLCDLQGGYYSDGVILTDPVVMSRTLQYGPTDLGPSGIKTFFSQHVCSEYCGRDWTRPADKRVYLNITRGTTMRVVPTKASRAPISHRFR